MTVATHMGSQFVSVSVPAEVSSFDQKKAEARARLKSRQTTFTPENIEMFRAEPAPEVSGELRKRFVFF